MYFEFQQFWLLIHDYLLSQTLYEQTPMRTVLLTWQFEELDLLVLADESYHDKKAVDVMKELDSDRCTYSFQY